MSPRRTHLAMIGVPIVSHVLPSLALIRELVTRGHRVTYANDPFVADRIEPVGAELVPCTSTLPVTDNDWPDTLRVITSSDRCVPRHLALCAIPTP